VKKANPLELIDGRLKGLEDRLFKLELQFAGIKADMKWVKWMVTPVFLITLVTMLAMLVQLMR